MKHLFIINPKAGVKNSATIIEEEVKSLFNEGEYKIHLTKESKEAIGYIKEYLSLHNNETVRIYSCGGDGTLNEVINGAYGFNNAEVTCYPSGSGNDFLKVFGDFNKFLDIKTLKEGKVLSIDIIKVNDRYGINIFNTGVDSKVVVKQRRIKRWPLVSGKLAYTLGLVAAFFGKISAKYKLVIDDEVAYEGKGMLCAVANGICYGGGYYCAPSAKYDDGLLDVCLVKKISKVGFLTMVGDYKKGNHLNKERIAKHIVYKTGRKVHLQLDKEWPYSIDGELIFSKDIMLEVIPKGIKFVIPSEK